jgi:hypothetical protein
MDGPNGPTIKSVEEMAGRFHGELLMLVPTWKQRLSEDPTRLEELEREVQAAFARGADMLVVGLMAVEMKQSKFDQACERTRRDYRSPLSRGRMRQLQIRLLGGLLVWVTSLYCAPRRRRTGSREENVPGLYVELAQFGFGKGCTPGLQSRVARQAALCPSLQLAQQELERDGVKLDVKTVRRIAHQCGQGLLALRTHELVEWRAGKLAAGRELAGQRVAVQIDGGRTKIRGSLSDAAPREEALDEEGLVTQDAPGRSKPRAKKTFPAEWREPKLVTIFVHDERGRMVKGTHATIEGTFAGPDALAELIALHLHRLGAVHAQSITFVADGAPWIWDRIGTIVRLAHLAGVTVYEILDCCHATHHISLALAALGLSDQERMPLYRENRTQLRNGHWRQVVQQLTELGASDPPNEKLQTEIAYLKKHGEAGRMKYPAYKGQGLPLGSGAIESSIRRVINLRLKGNGIFWREENAEAMLQLRATILTNRWDQRLQAAREHLRHDGRLRTAWEPQPMSIKVECAPQNST